MVGWNEQEGCRSPERKFLKMYVTVEKDSNFAEELELDESFRIKLIDNNYDVSEVIDQ